MELVFIVALVSILTIIVFFIGATAGRMVARHEIEGHILNESDKYRTIIDKLNKGQMGDTMIKVIDKLTNKILEVM